MNINILSPNGTERTIELSREMKKHFDIPINHAHTILNQINSGMYAKWFAGKKNLVVVDFGANVGLTGLYFLPACKELYCIEPTPKHYELCKELLFANNPDTNVSLSDFALCDADEEVIFMTGHSTENKITSADGYGNGKITVPGKPLSYFLQNLDKVDFCKVDIEGGEMLALTEAELKKVKSKVKCFFVEVHPAYNGGMEQNYKELITRFANAGYSIEGIDYQTFAAYNDR